MSTRESVERRHREEADNWLDCLGDPERKRIAESWFRTDTVNEWRHRRMYDCLDPLIRAFPGAEWLTVGDGRFGKDAHAIIEKGGRALATDVSDVLLEVAADRGYIRDYRVANAEGLPFEDDAFDFAFCKESLHHFPRPPLAIYEMLRVARKGVAFIEPCEAPVLGTWKFVAARVAKWALIRIGLGRLFRSRDTSVLRIFDDTWEEVGNYVYRISRREIEKMALGVECAACAFKGLNDRYEKGVEFEKAVEDSPLFRRIRRRIASADRRSRRGLSRGHPQMLVAIVFKEPVEPPLASALLEHGYELRPLPANPHRPVAS